MLCFAFNHPRWDSNSPWILNFIVATLPNSFEPKTSLIGHSSTIIEFNWCGWKANHDHLWMIPNYYWPDQISLPHTLKGCSSAECVSDILTLSTPSDNPCGGDYPLISGSHSICSLTQLDLAPPSKWVNLAGRCSFISSSCCCCCFFFLFPLVEWWDMERRRGKGRTGNCVHTITPHRDWGYR